MSDDEDNPKGFFASIKKGYDDQDRAISREKEKSDINDRIKDGISTGIVDGLLNPARWIMTMFR